MRLINFAPFRSQAVPYFLHSNIMPITMLYFKLSSVLMFDVYNKTAPHNILHLFIPTQQVHPYSTRSSSSGNYYISHSRLKRKNDSFFIMGAKIWNSIPENVRNSSQSLFKEKVHTILLKIFDVQDRYADLNTIISDFKKILALTCLNSCLDFLISISLVTDLFYFISCFIINTVIFFTSTICNKSCTFYTPPASISLAICR